MLQLRLNKFSSWSSVGSQVTLQEYECEKNEDCDSEEKEIEKKSSKNRESENEIAKILQENFDLKKRNEQIRKV